jgi:putative membrane protein
VPSNLLGGWDNVSSWQAVPIRPQLRSRAEQGRNSWGCLADLAVFTHNLTALEWRQRARPSFRPRRRVDILTEAFSNMAKNPPPAAQAGETARAVVKQAEQLGRSADNIEASAGAVVRSADQLTDSADRRTVLAADRTMLAAERTYAAWIRTGLVALASGIGAHALLEQRTPQWFIIFMATAMIAFSAFCFVAAVWRQLQRVGSPEPDTPQLPAYLLVTFSVLLTLTAGASLLVIIFGYPRG